MLVACGCGARFQHRTPACPHCHEENDMAQLSRNGGLSTSPAEPAEAATDPEPVPVPVPEAEATPPPAKRTTKAAKPPDPVAVPVPD